MDSSTGKLWTKETMDKGHHGGRRRLWTKETIDKGKHGERRAKQPMRTGDYDQKRQWQTVDGPQLFFTKAMGQG